MTYEQSTGLWKAGDGRVLAECYSGYSTGKNNPGDQNKIGLGPIPQGKYTLGTPQHTKPGETSPHGPYVIPLTPDPGNTMFGRGGFLVHGDSIQSPGTASHGCVIPLKGKVDTEKVLTGRPLREALSAHADMENRRLEVVSGPVPVPVIVSG
jgi:hypothetical protein